MKFGENLKLIRKSKKISQEELADILGVSRQSVSKWETGENYPSMTNILCLCDIFKCKINELVHEDFIDINSLDEEIKMSVVKFKQKEQKKMKGLSKLIYCVARVFKVVSIVGIAASIVFFIGSMIVMPNIKFDTKKQTVKIYNDVYNYKYVENQLKIDNKVDNYNIQITPEVRKEIDKFATKSVSYRTSFVMVFSISLMIACFCLFKMLGYLEKLFKNIHDNDTPFNSDNVYNIRKIALFLALFILIPDVCGILTGMIFNLDLSVEVDLINYLFVIVVLVISYIFKYGYEIQLDSKGKIYGDIDE